VSVRVEHGDSRAVLKKFGDASVDSCVTDPPYSLVSIQKRFGKVGSAPAQEGRDGLYRRASAGFMGKQWDTGETAFDPDFWREVYRVLKPGAHLIAFSGTRTYHRMACAIEDAGFEIRDQIGWLYGSGFPKSHDVSKGIDKRRDWSALPRLQTEIRARRLKLGISQSAAARMMGLIGKGESLGGGGFMWFETGMRMPTRDQWPRLKAALNIGDAFDLCFEEAEREITGTVDEWTNRSNYALTSKDGFRRDKPASEAAAEWHGWGTALKPAWEPMVLARKPLVGTVAENVLLHRTGALNVDGCRVEGVKPKMAAIDSGQRNNPILQTRSATATGEMSTEGRWPANVIHDGSDEAVSAFPDASGAQRPISGNEQSTPAKNVYGTFGRSPSSEPRGDSGSAARFFYSAKADAVDRFGSKHPTVKPIDLMAYLCRLVTPPGGLVLDPFAGSGTTGAACLREKFECILIEREADYIADIHARLEAVTAEGRHSIEIRNRNVPEDKRGGLDLPLFASGAA
jgi:DNA modification methylase